VSKAAGHSLTQALRAELEGQGTKVVGVYPGPIDTDMAAEIDLPKTPAVEVARAALEAVERGFEDVFPDPFAARFRDDLARDAKALEKRIGAMVQAG
jgi:NAD(P)-dependent dehydrogenase (short-subunit alcohol dehydrogenase family)